MAPRAEGCERRHGFGNGGERKRGCHRYVQSGRLPRGRIYFQVRCYRSARSADAVKRRTQMRRSNFALRLQPSLMEEARKAAEGEGVALNQLINVAIAEKVSTLRTEDYFRERARRANRT